MNLYLFCIGYMLFFSGHDVSKATYYHVMFPQDCMEEINLFSENKSHLKQLGEQLLLASDEAKQTQVHGSLQEVNQRWHNLFHQIESR